MDIEEPDNDLQCRGYFSWILGKPEGECQLATTAVCPPGCTKFPGDLGELDSTSSCGADYGGCYIKIIGKR